MKVLTKLKVNNEKQIFKSLENKHIVIIFLINFMENIVKQIRGCFVVILFSALSSLFYELFICIIFIYFLSLFKLMIQNKRSGLYII